MGWTKNNSLKTAYMYVKNFYAALSLCIVVIYITLPDLLCFAFVVIYLITCCVLPLLQLESISAKHRSCKVNLALATLYQKTGGNDRSAVTAYKEVLRWNIASVSSCPVSLN